MTVVSLLGFPQEHLNDDTGPLGKQQGMGDRVGTRGSGVDYGGPEGPRYN